MPVVEVLYYFTGKPSILTFAFEEIYQSRLSLNHVYKEDFHSSIAYYYRDGYRQYFLVPGMEIPAAYACTIELSCNKFRYLCINKRYSRACTQLETIISAFF